MRDETNFNRSMEISSLELEARQKNDLSNDDITADSHAEGELDMREAVPSRPGDEILEEYAEQDVTRVHADAGLSGSGTAFLNQERLSGSEETNTNEEQPLEDIPDADEIQANSPVDPAAPPVDHMHGTDLLNGSSGEDEEA